MRRTHSNRNTRLADRHNAQSVRNTNRHQPIMFSFDGARDLRKRFEGERRIRRIAQLCNGFVFESVARSAQKQDVGARRWRRGLSEEAGCVERGVG